MRTLLQQSLEYGGVEHNNTHGHDYFCNVPYVGPKGLNQPAMYIEYSGKTSRDSISEKEDLSCGQRKEKKMNVQDFCCVRWIQVIT